MNDLWKVLGQPVEITLSGTAYKARMLPIKTVFAWAETQVVKEAMANVKSLAESLDGKEKLDFLIKAGKELVPTGKELQTKALARTKTLDMLEELLFQALTRDQPELTREEIECLLEDNLTEIESFLPLLMRGAEKPKGSPNPKKAQSRRKS